MKIGINTLLFSISQALDCVENALLGVATNHSRRVACVSMRICRRMGLSEADVFDMGTCAVLHDNALTEYMQAVGPERCRRLENLDIHCAAGERNARDFPFQGRADGVVLHHHENWDGSGVHKLRGEAIPLRAAALRLADNVDARFSLGTADPALPENVLAHVRRERERIYAPETADVFLELFGEDMLQDLSDERIDASLTEVMPPLEGELSMPQLLRICRIFSGIIDAKSPFTKNHSQGIAEKTGYMASFYGMDAERRDMLVVAAHLHDLGKLSIPADILEKPGSLSEEEFLVMRGHASMSWEILSGVAGMEDIALWAAGHHEKLDGTGYPFGRRAEELPFESRLLACVDIYQALTEERPYRAGMEHRRAMYILEGMAAHGKIDGDIVRKMGPALEHFSPEKCS